MGNVDLRPLTPARETEWTEFVESRPAATVFHGLDWKRTLERTFSYRPRYRLAYDGRELVGAVPGFEVPTLVGTTVTMPFGEYGFPLADDPKPVLSALADATRTLETRILKESHWTGTVGYGELGYGGVETGICLRLGVDRPYESVWQDSFTSGGRRNVRRAREHDLAVREPEGFEAYYRLYLETMRRLGSPPFPEEFFTALREELESGVSVLLAELEGRTVAGLLAFSWGDTRLIWGNVSTHDAWKAKPNDLLYAETIRRACESDESIVDFGRNERESGVHEFKSQFGGEPSALTSLVYPPWRTDAASISGYKRAAPLAERLAPIITHDSVGPRLKRWIHE